MAWQGRTPAVARILSFPPAMLVSCPWSSAVMFWKPSPSATWAPPGDATRGSDLGSLCSVGTCAWSGRPCNKITIQGKRP
jgi:hypothetical protein